MGRRKNKVVEDVRLGDMVAEGKCISRIDGQAVFIEGGVPGDLADILILKDKKSYAEAKVWKLKEKSDFRVEAYCTHFGVCGGCKWQNLDYATQLKFKQQQVEDALQRIGKLVDLPSFNTILPSDATKHYRNKLEFTFTNRRYLLAEEMGIESSEREALGFHVPGLYDKVLQIDTCYHQPEPSNSIRKRVFELAKATGLPFFDLRNMEGYYRTLMIRNNLKGEFMVLLQIASIETEAATKLLLELAEEFPGIKSLYLVVNQKGNDTIYDLEVKCLKGEPFLIEEMEGLKFRIGPKSFFQTNAEQAYKLYAETRRMAQLTGNELVYDLYTGTGTIALFLAKSAKKVVGIESVEMAVEDARINASENGIENASFFSGDMRKILSKEFIATHGKPEVVITDPPRAGMHPDVVQELLDLEAQRIVYVSCNPATQARDLNLLQEKYEVVEIQPVDMFPHTIHVENIVSLRLKSVV